MPVKHLFDVPARLLPLLLMLFCLPTLASSKAQDLLANNSGWFEKNSGQFTEAVKFIYHTTGESLIFAGNCLSKTARQPTSSRLCLEHSNQHNEVRGEQPLPGKISYMPGNNRDDWLGNIARYKKIFLGDIYDGIDMRFYKSGQDMEFDFIIAPDASSETIRLRLHGYKAELQADDSLLISNGEERLRLSPPLAYQLVDEQKISVACSFDLSEKNVIALKTGHYDKTKPLIIDPVLSWSSYLGGTNDDYAFAVSSDASNHIYLAGYTSSSNFPVTAAYQSQLGGFASAFVAKFSPPPNSQPIYITYVGNDVAEVRGMAIDEAGNAYVTGSTSSTTFPTVNAFQNSKAGIIDAYVFKLNATGDDLVYSTYFGGNSVDRGRAIALDNSGNAYITGVTASTTFPVLNAIQAGNAGVQDAYVLKLASSGNAVIYSTYLGGSGGDYGAAIYVDTAGNAYIAGNSTSTDYPLFDADQSSHGGNEDAIITMLDSTGALAYSSYLGGSADDFATAIVRNSQGDVFVAGNTQSSDLAFLAIGGRPLGGTRDAFISRINPSDKSRARSLLIGGSGEDSALSMQIDFQNDLHIAGVTTSVDLPVTLPVQAGNGGGASDIFINTLSFDTTENKFMSYLGGSGTDTVRSMMLNAQFDLLIAGETSSGDFPVQQAMQTNNAGSTDAFVSIISLDVDGDLVPDYSDNCPDNYNPLQEDDNNNGTGNACEPPQITGFWPGSANAGDFIFVFGSAFASNATSVSVNNIDASLVQVVTADMLIFALPAGDTNGPVSVTTGIGSATSSTNFGDAAAGVSISGIWPGMGATPGDFVFVFGTGFQYPISLSIGMLNIPLVQVVNEGMLIFILPDGSTTGTINITTQGQSVSSDSAYTVLGN